MNSIYLPTLGTSTSKLPTVISSRVTLLRNIDALAFPDKLLDKEKNLIIQNISPIIHVLDEDIQEFSLKEMSTQEHLSLLSRLIITQKFLDHGDKFFIKKDGSFILLPNETDHIKLFSIEYGTSLKSIYKRLSNILSLLDQQIHFAFNSEFGFLTSNITFAGNGLQLSVLMSLPALELQGSINNFKEICYETGYNLKPFHFQYQTGLYLLQNIGSFGISELSHIDHMMSLIQKLNDVEKIARKNLLEDQENKELIFSQIQHSLNNPINYHDALQILTWVDLLAPKYYKISDKQAWYEHIFRWDNNSEYFKNIHDFEEANQQRNTLLKHAFQKYVHKP